MNELIPKDYRPLSLVDWAEVVRAGEVVLEWTQDIIDLLDSLGASTLAEAKEMIGTRG